MFYGTKNAVIKEINASNVSLPKPLLRPDINERVECTASGPLYYVLRVSQLVGVAPVRFQRKRDGWRVTLAPELNVLGYIIATVLNGLILTVINIDLLTGGSTSGPTFSMHWVWFFVLFIGMVNASYALIRAPKRIKTLIQCMNRIQKLKTTLNRKNQIYVNERKKCLPMIFAIATLLLICAAEIGIIFKDSPSLSQHFPTANLIYSSFLLAYPLVLLMMLQFIYSAIEVQSTLKEINNLLELILEPWDVRQIECGGKLGIPTDRISKSVEEVICNVTSMYGTICDVVSELDAANGTGIMLILTSCFLHLICMPYHFINNLYSLTCGNPVPWYQMAKKLYWCVLHFFWLLALVEPSHLTQSEMDRSGILVSKLSIKETDRTIAAELDKFSQYLLLNKVTYSPMGICTLSRSLIATIVASVTTYLVIIIQFQTLDGNQL